ncbi:hypothetical protein BDN70DRAFT_887516 [Pholiota conissans]|uniref:Uncharacterized protein n=1 Tax=Pholiota conissans TaxID=109636 RepID=A0A9P5YQ91_9AGAR|nr:hypothetical protein BDN70DRAFT_887516 [Pholiota conissans]
MSSLWDGEPTGRLSSLIARIGRSRKLRDCRTYYRFALFFMSIITFLNSLVLILSIFKFAIYDFVYFSMMTLFCGFLAGCIHYLIKFSNMPDSDHWLTNAQTHITGSSIIAFVMFSYSSSLRRPFSAPLHACLALNTKDFLGNIRCQIVLVMDAISWLAPFSMLIAAWVVYFSAAHSGQSAGWRHVNVADVNEPQGEVALP